MSQSASSNSLKKNFSYRLTMSFALYALNFVTFPYVTRMLGAENFGKVNFVISTVDYFLLFATMGMTVLGMREIAAVRNDKRRLSEVFTQLFGINLAFSLIIGVIYVITIATVPKFHNYEQLFMVGLIRIVTNVFVIDWLFAGLERFKYAAISTTVVKVIYVASIFVFVREASDYAFYFYATVGFTVLCGLINFIYARRFVTIIPRLILSRRYLRENCVLGVSAIAQNFYITFNVVFLGFAADSVEVGYYSTAVKLYFCCVSLFGAFTGIMSPRMASLLATDNAKQHDDYVRRSSMVALVSGVLVAVFGYMLAPYIVRIVAGGDFEGAIAPLRLLVIALIPQFINQVVIYQVIVPMKRDNLLLTVSLVGSALTILFNVIFIPRFAAVGASISLLLCEVLVMIIYIVYCRVKRLPQFPTFGHVQ